MNRSTTEARTSHSWQSLTMTFDIYYYSLKLNYFVNTASNSLLYFCTTIIFYVQITVKPAIMDTLK